VSRLGARLRAIPSWQITLGVALLVLGFLIAAQLATEGPRVRYTTQERSPLVETALELQRQQEVLKDRILEVRAEIDRTGQASRGSAALVRELNDQLSEARMAAGLVAIVGPGLVFQLEDSTTPTPAGGNDADYRVTAHDIRTLVEELWLAGAEAIAINGERLTTPSAIVDIGGSVLVNQAYLAPPYQISSIGPTDVYEQLAASQGYRDFVDSRVNGFGIGASFGEFERVELPAYAGPLRLDYANVAPSADPGTGTP
jgi:uncharacterized protein YlxW (UPF0749 family)